MPDTPFNSKSTQLLGGVANLEQMLAQAVRGVLIKKLHPLAQGEDVDRATLAHVLAHEEEIVVVLVDTTQEKLGELLSGWPPPTPDQPPVESHSMVA